MNKIFVHGIGAVSPAGWSVSDLREALEKNEPLPVQNLARPGLEKPLSIRAVPTPNPRPAFFSHPRLRRANSITQFTVAAALEALGARAEKIQSGELRLGVIVSVMAGSVNYSRRFFEEVMSDPAVASPLIFPETVFNAPASHLAAFLGAGGINYTLVGDDGTFLQALALAANWLTEEKVDACVVVGAEETDWIVADVIKLFQRDAIHSAGAGAILLIKDSDGAIAELAAVTDSFSFTQKQNCTEAARKMRMQLPPNPSGKKISDEKFEKIFGKAFVASAAWQCVATCDAIARGEISDANVEIIGANQQAIGARFVK